MTFYKGKHGQGTKVTSLYVPLVHVEEGRIKIYEDDGIILYNCGTRSSERRVWDIDVGKLPTLKTQAFINKIMDTQWKLEN